MGDDEDLTTTTEEQLAREDGSDPQTEHRAEADQKDPAPGSSSGDELQALQDENAETSLDQPSDDAS